MKSGGITHVEPLSTANDHPLAFSSKLTKVWGQNGWGNNGSRHLSNETIGLWVWISAMAPHYYQRAVTHSCTGLYPPPLRRLLYKPLPSTWNHHVFKNFHLSSLFYPLRSRSCSCPSSWRCISLYLPLHLSKKTGSNQLFTVSGLLSSGNLRTLTRF